MFFLFLFFCLFFIIGAALMLIGFISKNNKSYIKAGVIICAIPIAFTIVPFFFNKIIIAFKLTPSQKDLTGEYVIADVSNLKLSEALYYKYKLVLKKDSTFTLTPTPYIETCNSGRYEVDFAFNGNELSYRCESGGYTFSHIERKFSGFRIQFIIGDPDSGQSIYFEKVKP